MGGGISLCKVLFSLENKKTPLLMGQQWANHMLTVQLASIITHNHSDETQNINGESLWQSSTKKFITLDTTRPTLVWVICVSEKTICIWAATSGIFQTCNHLHALKHPQMFALASKGENLDLLFIYLIPTVSCQDWEKGTISSWWNLYIYIYLLVDRSPHGRNEKCTSLFIIIQQTQIQWSQFNNQEYC